MQRFGGSLNLHVHRFGPEGYIFNMAARHSAGIALLAAASMCGCRDGDPKVAALAREEAIVDVGSPGIGIPARTPDDLSSAEIERIVLKNVKLLVDPCRAAALRAGKSRYKALMTVDSKGRATEWLTEPPFTSLELCVNGEMWRIAFPPTTRGGKAEIVIAF